MSRGNESNVETGLFTTRLDSIIGWCRKYSLWPFPFGTACCAIEFMAAVGAHYDISRFGAEAVRFSPRQADLLIVSGTVTDKMGPILKKIYTQMSEPKWVISMGVCASSGGFYRAYHVMQGIDEIVPVDVYVPGCPPTPEGLLKALLMIQDMAAGKIGRRAAIVPFSAPEKSRYHKKKLSPWPRHEIGAVVPETIEDSDAADVARLAGDALIGVHESGPDGIPEIVLARDVIVEACRFLCDDEAMCFDMLMDLCGVDYMGRTPRFEVVYHLYSTVRNKYLRLRVPLDENDVSVRTVTGVWKGADWFEREAYDMFGIRFEGHHNLQKLLTHDQFDGHALRKDFEPGHRFECTETRPDLFTAAEDTLNPPLHQSDDEELGERTIVNLGPSHPITHGTLRLMIELEGETILRSRSEIGYLHRCFEKMAETHPYIQIIPYTDRLNYCSAFMNNAGYAHAVETMMGVEVPRRAQVLRVILSEFSRIMDHFVCIGANLVDIGALTNFWYLFRMREEIYDLLESCCGARLTVSYGRIGGFSQDVPHDFVEKCRRIIGIIPGFVGDVDKLITRNKIFAGRTRGIGTVTAGNAIAWGFTGPCLRASGVGYDVRKANPYWTYGQYDFDVPVSGDGDVMARYLVRLEEITQSLRIITQALADLPDGPVMTSDKRVALPPKKDVYGNIEGLMNHFKIIMHGFETPAGNIYSSTEGANGELGFYIVSDGTSRPYRIKVRPPCFAVFQANDEIVTGHMVSDVAAIIGSWNVIAGELDR